MSDWLWRANVNNSVLHAVYSFCLLQWTIPLNSVSKWLFFLIFLDIQVFVGSVKVLEKFLWGSWKVLDFFSVKEWEPWLMQIAALLCTLLLLLHDARSCELLLLHAIVTDCALLHVTVYCWCCCRCAMSLMCDVVCSAFFLIAACYFCCKLFVLLLLLLTCYCIVDAHCCAVVTQSWQWATFCDQWPKWPIQLTRDPVAQYGMSRPWLLTVMWNLEFWGPIYKESYEFHKFFVSFS